MRFTLADKYPNDQKNKGSFGAHRLPLAMQYFTPQRLLFYLRSAILAALAVSAYLLLDLNCNQGRAFMPGPLSSNHANFGETCSKCHDLGNTVTNANCSACHEKVGDTLGTYSFASHYVYKSDSLERAQRRRTLTQELPCRTCHIEHRGHMVTLSSVPDKFCTNCHEYGSFNDEHPQFAFARPSPSPVPELVEGELIEGKLIIAPDDSALHFTHIRHVAEVRKREKLLDVETACLFCHNPDPDGKLFGAINFERHCAACHLTQSSTPPLQLATAAEPGVLTIENIRKLNTVESLWARQADPTVFGQAPGGRIVKTRVEHEDEWIIFNLNRLSEAEGLAALVASANKRNAGAEIKNRIAAGIKMLSGGNDIDLQAQLAFMDSTVKAITAGRPAALDAIAAPALRDASALQKKIAQPCLECHTLQGGKIAWASGEQDVLHRANFNHRAHILQRRCLECHTEINMTPPPADSVAAKIGDRASVQNLPRIETCRQCHTQDKASERCITCHDFHPNKAQRANLVRYFSP